MMVYISHVSLRPHAEPISVFERQQQTMTGHTRRPALPIATVQIKTVIPIRHA